MTRDQAGTGSWSKRTPPLGDRALLTPVRKRQLDQLEVRGYLDPDRRGDRADEAEAIETFLMDGLTKR